MTPSSCIDGRSCYPYFCSGCQDSSHGLAPSPEDCRNPHAPLRIIGGIRLRQERAKGSWGSGPVSTVCDSPSLPRFGGERTVSYLHPLHSAPIFVVGILLGTDFWIELSAEHVVDISWHNFACSEPNIPQCYSMFTPQKTWTDMERHTFLMPIPSHDPDPRLQDARHGVAREDEGMAGKALHARRAQIWR